MRPLRAAATAVVLAAALATTPAAALEVPPDVTAGRLLPPAPMPPERASLSTTASGSFYWLRLPSVDDFTPYTSEIRSLTDNSLARTTPYGARLAGDSYYEYVDPTAPSVQRIVMHDVLTDTTRWSIDVPQGEYAFAVDENWVLTARSDTTGYVVRHGDGTVTTISAPVDTELLAQDGRSVVVGGGGADAVRIIDIATGDVRTLPTEGWVPRALLAPDRVYWIGMSGQSVGWAERDGSAPTTRTLAAHPFGVWGWFTVGNALTELVSDPSTNQASLRLVDLTTGQLGSTIMDDVVGDAAAQAAPGKVVVINRATPSGTVEVVESTTSAPRVVGTVPVVPRRAGVVTLSGSRALADFGYGEFDPTNGLPLAIPTDGSGSWSPKPTSDSPALTGTLRGAAGDVVLTKVPGSDSYRLTWPGGERTVTGHFAARLGHGGKVLISMVSNAWVIEDARTGVVLSRPTTTSGPAVDGVTLWQGPDADRRMTATNLLTGQVVGTATVSRDGCDNGLRDVRDHWAHLDCSSGSLVVDLDGVLTDRVVSTGAAPSLYGNGFVGFVELRREVSSTTPFYVLRVRDLGPGGGERTYGPLVTRNDISELVPVADDSGAARLAYVDAGWQIRVVDLGWLTSTPSALSDAKAPDLTSFTTTPRVATGATVSATWSYTDTTDAAGQRAAGVASYDVRYQQGPVGGPYGSWVTTSATTTPSLALAPARGVDTCFSVRARDSRGNVSGWTAPECSVRDGHAPTLVSVAGSPRVATSTTLAFSWGFVDPAEATGLAGSGIASYDVRFQTAPKVGGTYAAWNYRTEWQAMKATSISLPYVVKGTDVCFQVRARDGAGQTSAWSSSRCSSPDSAAPTLSSASTGPLVVPSVATSKVTFSYRMGDNVGVRSYDIAYRYAAPGQRLGAYVYPAGWQGSTASSVSLSVIPGAQVCFVVRARDAIGNLSGWSARRCGTVPADDRSMVMTGSASRITTSLALGGTATRLNAAGATVSKGGLTGDVIYLVVLKGPAQGTVEVTMSNHVFGRYSLYAPTWRREVITLRNLVFTSATLKVRALTSAQARIDAVAVQRS